jgi:hypothetical protein
MRKVYQSTRDHEILKEKTKNTNMVVGWNLKFTFYFMETAHELLLLEKWNFVQWKIMDIPTSFILNLIFFAGVFEYGSDSKLWGYAGTNANHFV